jgi:hypothetical protein
MKSLLVRAGTIGELFSLVIENGRWWLVPMIAVLIGTCALLLLLHAAEYVAPFVYSIF